MTINRILLLCGAAFAVNSFTPATAQEQTDSILEIRLIDGSTLYGVLTRGTSDRAVSLGVGVAYDDDGFLDEPIVMLGAEFRVSRTIKLITENYFIPDVGLITFGPRFFGERPSADLGIGLFVEDSDVFTVPIVNFVYVC